jgi:hypothetical protein
VAAVYFGDEAFQIGMDGAILGRHGKGRPTVTIPHLAERIADPSRIAYGAMQPNRIVDPIRR